jgi:Glycosyltransferases involved in cell wall biogenesis
MNKPLISFVLPTFNRVEWVGEAMQGLLMQTIKDIELIVVDDCSTDGTDELLQWFASKDSRVKVIKNGTNQGAGQSRNIGNNVATADLIGVCDSDDVYPDNRAEDTLEFFKANEGPIMMTAPYVRVNYFGQNTEDFNGLPFDEKLFKETGAINYFCHPAAAYRKSDILEIGGYKRETDTITDDYQLVKDWIAAGKKIGFAGENYLCGHRVLPNSIMAKQRGFRPEWAA